jgi:tetratricopeptide (TPR) repeat protein
VPIERAAVLRNAEKLLRQGKLDMAIAEYLRVVEDQPHDWNTANTLGDLYMRAGQSDRAVDQFVRIADSLRHDGFQSKAAALYKKILKIRPDDEHALLQAAELAASQGVLVDARAYFVALAARRDARRDEAGAADVRSRMFQMYLGAGDLDRAREFVATPEERIALGQAFAARGDADAAGEFLTMDVAGADPDLLLMLARTRLQSGEFDEGLAMLQQLLNQDAALGATVAAVGWELTAADPDVSLRVIEVVAETAIIEADWAAAAALFQEFTDRVPNHVPALQRLVEICFDGGLETAMYAAETRLADAYLATGCAAEARVVAEDLMARESAEPLHVEQLRQALIMLGEEDPDAIIAERRGQSLDEAEMPGMDALEVSPVAPSEPIASLRHAGHPVEPPEVETAAGDAQLSIAQPEKRRDPPPPAGGDGDMEIDLSDVLAELTLGTPPPLRSDDLDAVFEQMRDDSSRAPAPSAARLEYDRGVQLREAGRVEESMRAFEAASRDPRWRFRAAAALAHLHLECADQAHAVEWFEQAVQAPPPDADEAHALFYELADTLESMGEIDRALAVCLELQADAGDYRDLPARIRRLTGA